MTLLFDQNLSPKLVKRLADLFPGSSHMQLEGLDRASDDQIWDHARLNGFAIVTKDADYNNLSVLKGWPFRTSGCYWGTARPLRWRRCFVTALLTLRRSTRILLWEPWR
jgi:predicted nuclease of predicted toxin-antitoxin system